MMKKHNEYYIQGNKPLLAKMGWGRRARRQSVGRLCQVILPGGGTPGGWVLGVPLQPGAVI